MTAAELQELQAEWAAIEANTSATEFGRVDLRTIKKIAATVRKCLGVTEAVSMKSLPQFIIRIAQMSAGEHNTIDDIVDSVDDLGVAVGNLETAVGGNTTAVTTLNTTVGRLKTNTFTYVDESNPIYSLTLQNLSDYSVDGDCVSANGMTIRFAGNSFFHGFMSYVRFHNAWKNSPEFYKIYNNLGSGKILKVYVNGTLKATTVNEGLADLTTDLSGYDVLNMVFECDAIYMNCYIQGLEE